MSDSAHVDRRNIGQKIAAVAAIRAEIEALTSDPIAIRDTLEGAVDFEGIVDFLLGDIAFNDTMIEAIEIQIKDLKERAERLQKRTDAERGLIKKALEEARLSNCERPTATIILAKKLPTLGTLEEAKIPTEFWDEQPMKLNRGRLLDALKLKRAVPGAQLAEETKILQIRRS